MTTFHPEHGDRKAGPLYRQVADELERLISTGMLPDGKLPAEPVLAKRFKVSVITIKWAMRILQEKGLIVRRQGLGTFARCAQPLARVPSPISRKPDQLRWLQLRDLSYAQDVNAAIRDRFESLSPGVALTILRPTDLEGPLESLAHALEHVDVVTMDSLWLNRLMGRNALLELDQAHFDTLNFDDYYPQATQQATTDGKWFALPRMLNPTALYCNMDMLEEAGVTPPTSRMGWDELTHQLRRLPASRDGKPLWRLGWFRFAMLFWEHFAWQHQADIYDPSTGCFTADSPRFIEAIDAAKAVLRFDPQCIDLTERSLPFFTEGRGRNLACFIGGPMFSMLLGQSTDRWKVFPLPADASPAAAGVSFQVGIMRQTHQPDLAHLLLGLICGPFGQNLLARSGTSMPAWRPAVEPLWRKPSNIDRTGFLDSIDHLRQVQPWVYQPMVSHLATANIRQAFDGKQATAAACGHLNRMLNGLALPREEAWSLKELGSWASMS